MKAMPGDQDRAEPLARLERAEASLEELRIRIEYDDADAHLDAMLALLDTALAEIRVLKK